MIGCVGMVAQLVIVRRVGCGAAVLAVGAQAFFSLFLLCDVPSTLRRR